MSTTVHAHAISAGSFDITTSTGHTITLGNAEENLGPRPMEMLLVALAGCAGIGISSLARKMRQEVTAYDISIQSERAATDPKVYTRIIVEHTFTGHDLDPVKLQRAIELDTSTYCGVNVMLGASAAIEHKLIVKEAE